MAQRTCSINECDSPIWARGWCRVHYSRWYDYGDPLALVTRRSPNPGACCSVKECDAQATARGWCGKHYQRWTKYGDPLGSAPKRPTRLCDFPDCGRKHRADGYCAAHLNQLRRGHELEAIHPSRGQWKYTLDYGYFDEITDKRRAYWLGFITADGCIRQHDQRAALTVTLKASDSGHLATLCEDLGSDRPVLFARTEATVIFNSKQIVAALGRHGVGPRKSGTVQPWNGPADLMPHYWRGMFDGDGCIHRQSRSRKWSLSLVGSKACVAAFASWAHEACASAAQPRQLQGCWGWAVGGTRMPQSLAGALYGNTEIALARKRVLADQLLALNFAKPG